MKSSLPCCRMPRTPPGRSVQRCPRQELTRAASASTWPAVSVPGGQPAAAWCHVARTVCRRAERDVVTLARQEPVNPEVVVYLNRLSDLLFVLARVYNNNGRDDVLWQPGKTANG